VRYGKWNANGWAESILGKSNVMAKGTTRRNDSLKEIILLVFIALGSVENMAAGSLWVSWSSVSDSRVAGYKIKYGTQSGSYPQSIDIGSSNSYRLVNLADGVTYFLQVTAYDASRIEGTPSAEVSGVVLKASNIAVSSITSASAIISWQTNKPATSQVEYGTTTGYGRVTVLDPTFTLSPKQSLLNLLPNTQYHLRVHSQDQGGGTFVSGDFTFTTTATTSSRCDPNLDGSTTATDLQMVINAILSGSNSPAYDINKDGKVDATDLQLLGNVILGASSCPL
jgi:fibronectin type 3 domain-containing protein